jgi:hypothetical protein
MAAFIIIPIGNTSDIDAAVAQKFPGDSFRLPKGEHLVVFDGTSKELSDRLGISDGQVGSALVVGINGYFGWASKDIWEWLQIKSA